ncbi:MAG TPA: trypsin-like peptidase domain-containing protein [Anaerolineae bacterium]|nr:trypsin-like peptidase domain-containing protein [Anaerolineae bacterium]
MVQLKRYAWLAVLMVLSLAVLPACNSLTLPGELVASADSAITAAPAVVQPQATDPLAESDVIVALEGRLQEIYAQVNQSVVNIQVATTGGALGAPQVPGTPFGPSTPQGPPVRRGLGSGFVWDKEGHIVTNNHVVADADQIVVVFADGFSARAEVVGADPDSDLAVIKVDVPAASLQPVQIADSTEVKVGELVVAIGNPFGLEGTMTVGFVSALGRSLPAASGSMAGASYTIPDIIQTDAPINPGNSGGVLVDDGGSVIGVTAAIESPVQANAGIGFAIPSVIVQKVVPVLITDGQYEHSWLGLSGTALSLELNEAMELGADQRGVLVMDTTPGGPADEAGLRGSDREVEIDGQPVNVGGDVIVAVDGQAVNDFEDLVTYLARHTEVGQTITLRVLREGAEVSVQVTLAARPEPQAPQTQPQRGIAGGAWLGIQGLTMTPEIAEAMDLSADQRGVLVAEAVENSPAAEAGLHGSSTSATVNGEQIMVGGDVIVALDGQTVAQFEELAGLVRQAEPGQAVTLTLLRDGEQIEVGVTLAERPTMPQTPN